MRSNSSRKAKPLRAAPGRRNRVNNFRQPPMLQPHIRTTRRFRFVATSAVAYNSITVKDLAGVCGVVGTVTNTTGAYLVGTLRVAKVEMWSPPASVGTSVSISMSWGGFNNSPNIEYTDSSVSQTEPAHIACRPPRESLAKFWQTTGNDSPLFILNCPTSTIIDVTIEFMEADSSSALTTTSLVTAVVGQRYYLALDDTSNHVIVPVGLFTTF